ncbi:hypothetical protein MTR_0027s0120 [Medicago truncatula]|uniref:Transmembrane protein n=1 Tax=Medicago truncatula TaxID=3880 RepID=A0A072TUP7_MEDTR|nr:hypothetical protein MTR_0027s0120 [Medicago truncatula]
MTIDHITSFLILPMCRVGLAMHFSVMETQHPITNGWGRVSNLGHPSYSPYKVNSNHYVT